MCERCPLILLPAKASFHGGPTLARLLVAHANHLYSSVARRVARIPAMSEMKSATKMYESSRLYVVARSNTAFEAACALFALANAHAHETVGWLVG